MPDKRPSQTDRLYDLLSDGEPHRTDEIVAKIYSGGALARVGARIWDVQKKYGVKIDGWHDHDNPKLYWYQIQEPKPLPAVSLSDLAIKEMNKQQIQEKLL